MATELEMLKSIDFGDIDGFGDPKLDKYFLDNDYWNKIINDSVFYVIGRKGTGKSSIYRMIAEQGKENGYVVDNRDFGDFPFEKLLQLDDNNFTKPNQYQSIWKSLLYNIFAKEISNNPVSLDETNIHFTAISNYASQCIGDIVQMHRELVSNTVKGEGAVALRFLSFNSGKENTITIGNGSNNVSAINAELERALIDYFTTCSEERKIIIQFDRLDDNYNLYQNNEQYFQSIISLFKVVYYLNQKFREKKISNAKIVLYLRSDILKELGKRDAESARWDDFSLEVNWAINNRSDWKTSELLKMINKRISASCIDPDATFDTIFNKTKINLRRKTTNEVIDPFQYIVEKTMHRPRDLIQFCKCIQKEAKETNSLYFRTIKDAEKNYGFWLVNSELSNEINPILHQTEPLFELLKLLGAKPFSLTTFNERYRSVSGLLMSAENLAFYLYDVGIFQNIDCTTRPARFKSSYRNKGRLDKNMMILIHPGVWVGINA